MKRLGLADLKRLRLRDWVIALLGLWMLLSPRVLHSWQDGTNAALGLWLMVAPWALGFAAHMTARTNSIVVGFLVAALALWAMVVDTDLRKWMGEWMHEHHLLR